MSTPDNWWAEKQTDNPGPSRIRVTLSREFTPAEAEHFSQVGFLVAAISEGETITVDGNRIWVESAVFDSRTAYQKIADLIGNGFVNIFPTAVRTFRELSPLREARASYLEALIGKEEVPASVTDHGFLDDLEAAGLLEPEGTSCDCC